MYFDVKAALRDIEDHGALPATSATSATSTGFSTFRATCVADVAGVAGHLREVRKSGTARRSAGNPAIAVDVSDPDTLLALLRASGPATCGAAATTLGWGAP